jgi:DNA-directed RNA polymerase subunit RPC12/RpoP
MTVAFLRGMDASDPLRWEPITRGAGAHEEERRVARSGRLASGTLACARCDAPVALSPGALSPTDSLSCPFCSHRAPVRDFLSLRSPSRPARVEVRVVDRARRAVRPAGSTAG